MMSTKELRRLSVIHNVLSGQIAQQEAAQILGLCARQIRRITKRVNSQGDKAIIHRSRGHPSHAAKPANLKNKIINLCKTKYKGFNPAFAAEKLFEIDKLTIHPETLRLWFREDDIAYKKRKGVKHRSWRPRKDCFGQMIQMDGSHHDWFEQRGPWCVLMGYIDDATGTFFGRFYDYEGTKPALDSFKRYIKKYGIPQSVYLDKHTTYKSNKKPSIEDELDNQKALSQVERVFKELGVDVIHADSPQAKGRIERSFNTHQDRLIKEMHLAGIKTIKQANRFLSCYYIPKHNRKFIVPAKNNTNLHRAIPKHIDLDRVFSIKNEAALRNDFTIRYDNQYYQVLNSIRAKRVTVEEKLNNRLYLYSKNKLLKYKPIDKTIEKPNKVYSLKPKKLYIPPMDHLSDDSKNHPLFFVCLLLAKKTYLGTFSY